eukprot:1464317-Rhodomonas_salina.2
MVTSGLVLPGGYAMRSSSGRSSTFWARGSWCPVSSYARPMPCPVLIWHVSGIHLCTPYAMSGAVCDDPY